MSRLLEVENLYVNYETSDGIVYALNGVSLNIDVGETLGLVGETGAGKTTLAKSILGIIPNPPGKIICGDIFYNDENLLEMTEIKRRSIRGNEISMIFQDPMTSLNPVLTVGDQISEVIKIHENVSKAEAKEKAKEMLEVVGISGERSEEYPHQFSGGMKQRVIIAIALACSPKLLIADEPTTALDVTIQAQVLDLMTNLKEKFKTAMLLITHDLGVVAQTCDKVAIMYAGEIVEYGLLNDIFKETAHPYTIGLFGSIPKLTDDSKRLKSIPGLIPDPMNLPQGCKFAPRCQFAKPICNEQIPQMVNIKGEHYAKCFKVQGII